MSDKKRPFMTDEERAQIGREHRLRGSETRERASSEPTADAFAEEDHLTPLEDVVKRIEHTKGAPLTVGELAVARRVHQIAADRHMRVRQQHITPEEPYRGAAGMTAEQEQRLDELEATVVETFGKSGKNGDFGTLKERVDKAEGRRWWALTFLAGVRVTVIGSAIAFGSWMGSIETEVEQLKARAFRVRGNGSTPEYPAAKENGH